MIEDEDPEDPFDDVLTDLMYEEPKRTYEALLRWSKRYPEYYKRFADYFVMSAITDMYAEADPEPETDEFDWLAEVGAIYGMQILRRQKEGIPDKTIIQLSPLDESVLAAIIALGVSRRRYIENIVAAIKKLSGSDVEQNTVLETLRSLEARYALFSYSPDKSKYPDLGGKDYFFMTPIGERSLKASKKARP